jgi:hypothetical protein
MVRIIVFQLTNLWRVYPALLGYGIKVFFSTHLRIPRHCEGMYKVASPCEALLWCHEPRLPVPARPLLVRHVDHWYSLAVGV